MAKTKYGCYLFDEANCYVISNADMEYAEDTCDESFTNPPIKMTVEAMDEDWEYAFDAKENFMNHSKLQDNLMAVLRGEFPEFRLTGVNVNEDGIYLVYNSTLPPEKLWDDMEGYSGGQVLVYGSFTILFEVEHLDGSPVEQYRVKVEDLECCKKNVQIIEYIGGRKYRKLDLSYDAPRYIPGQQYCVITEY